MIIAQRLRRLRIAKKLSQGDLERKTGLRRQYISRLENGRTTPSVSTLERLAGAFGMPVYRLFYQGDKPRRGALVAVPTNANGHREALGDPLTEQLLRLISRIGKPQQQLLLATALKMSQIQRANGSRGR